MAVRETVQAYGANGESEAEPLSALDRYSGGRVSPAPGVPYSEVG